MCDDEEPNYQKLVYPHPPPYDIVLGYRRWDDNDPKPRRPHPCKASKQSAPPPQQQQTHTCSTDPVVTVYVHLLPSGRGLNLAPEKFKPITELYTTSESQNSLIRLNKAQDNEKKSPEKYTNIDEVKANVKGIQKTVSCVFQKNLNEKTKKDSNAVKNITIGTVQKKKNKSWDNLQQFPLKLPLAQRVSDALEGVKRPCPMTEVDLPRNDQGKLSKSLTGNFTKQFSATFDSVKKTNEQVLEKSPSCQYLEYRKRARDVCKALSLEAGPMKKPEQPSPVLDQLKKAFSYRSEINVKTDQLQSLLKPNANPSADQNNSEFLQKEKVSQFMNKPELSRYSMPVPQKFEKIPNKSNETPKKESLPMCSHESSKEPIKNQMYGKRSSTNLWSVKKNISICHCPHFHTEEGMRKVCLQCSTDVKEFGQRLRVSHFSKEKIDKIGQEKWATIENEGERKKLAVKLNSGGKKLIKTKSKNSAREKIAEDKSKTGLRRNKKSIHILETIKQSKEPEENPNETKNHGDGQATKEAQKLRKLFAKLNAVERFLEIEKSSENPKGILKKNSDMDEILKNVTGDASFDQNDLRRKLKSKIVQHFHNWLDLEFNE